MIFFLTTSVVVWFKSEDKYPLNKPQMVLTSVIYTSIFLARAGISMITEIRKAAFLVCPASEDPKLLGSL